MARKLPKVRQQLGKYRIDRRLAEGGFAAVFRAFDTIEGLPIALKIPYPEALAGDAAENIKREVRLTARLEHPHICPIKNAEVIDGLFVIASPLGLETLADRLTRRLSAATALGFAEQLLEAVAFAHSQRLIHCDIKPENVILFAGQTLRLTDFGIAKIAARTRTLYASSSGTIGYIAPEQALGRPSSRSDVFSLGLVLYRMFSGLLPSWPYEWPLPGLDRLRRVLNPALIELLRRSIQVDDRKRFRDARQMLQAFRRAKSRALRTSPAPRRQLASSTAVRPRWRTVRYKEFQRRYGRALKTSAHCRRCGGPTSEPMCFCPWCHRVLTAQKGDPTFPRRCGRCGRGTKSDWRFCAWCYGPAIGPAQGLRYGDKRYAAKCSRPGCGPLMPYMRYCPWCRLKVRRRWPLPEDSSRCSGCGWGTLPEFWEACPWCGKPHSKGRGK